MKIILDTGSKKDRSILQQHDMHRCKLKELLDAVISSLVQTGSKESPSYSESDGGQNPHSLFCAMIYSNV